MGGREYWHMNCLLTRQIFPFMKSIVKMGTCIPNLLLMDHNDVIPRKKLPPVHPSFFQRIQNKMQYPPVISLPSNKIILLWGQGLLERLWANTPLPRIATENVTANICWIFNWNKSQCYTNLEMQRDRYSPTLNLIWIGVPKLLQYL